MIFTIVCDVLGKENNGTVIATMNLIKYLARKGHEVRVVSTAIKDVPNVKWYVLKEMYLGKLAEYILKRNQVELAKPDKEILYQAISDADCVHVEFPGILGMIASKMCYKLGIKLTVSFHCQAQNMTVHVGLAGVPLANKIVYEIFYKNCYRYASGIHFPTEFMKNEFERNIKKKVNGYIISNGVRDDVKRLDVEKPDYLKDKFVILNVGRLCGEKNQQQLIKAISKSKHKDDIVLLLAGGGPDKDKFLKLAKKLNVNMEINQYEHNELINIINMCDLYVHTAIYELEGIACLEAIACGKATLVSDSKESATSSFAVDDNLIFVHKGTKDLTNKIDHYFENRNELIEIGNKYYENNNIYNLDTAMNKMEDMLINSKRIDNNRKHHLFKRRRKDK